MKYVLLTLLLAACAPLPSPEADYWQCVAERGSYVECSHLEVIQ